MLSNRGHRLHILHPRFFKAKRPYGLVFVASFNDNNGSGQKKKKKKNKPLLQQKCPRPLYPVRFKTTQSMQNLYKAVS